MEDETLRLGGSIELVGFSDFDNGTMVILKKMIGNFVRKMEDRCGDFRLLRLHVKPVHHTNEIPKKFEFRGHIVEAGRTIPGELVEHNVFVGIDNLLKKIEKGL